MNMKMLLYMREEVKLEKCKRRWQKKIQFSISMCTECE